MNAFKIFLMSTFCILTVNRASAEAPARVLDEGSLAWEGSKYRGFLICPPPFMTSLWAGLHEISKDPVISSVEVALAGISLTVKVGRSTEQVWIQSGAGCAVNWGKIR